MAFADHYADALETLRAANLRRSAPTLAGMQRPRMDVDGQSCLVFCSNDYLGLAADARLIAEVAHAAERFGVGAGAARLVTGTMTAHREAEAALADFSPLPNAEAILFATGYQANATTIAALVGPNDIVFSDELNHASLIDGMRLSRAKVHRYAHGDMVALEEQLLASRKAGQRALVVSETVFSMNGDIPDLHALRRLSLEYDAGLYLDDAHALGVLGPEGRGALAASNVLADIHVGTLGKAFGLQGAFVAAAPAIVEYLRHFARGYVFSTAPSPALVAAIPLAIEIVRAADDARRTVLGHAKRLSLSLAELGYASLPSQSPIVPILIGDPGATAETSLALRESGVLVSAIRPPTVPTGTSRLRMVATAAHTDADITAAITAFAKIRELGK